MKIDYTKLTFTREEINYMRNETDILFEKNPNHIPILIQVKSNVLKMDKYKFLVIKDILFSDLVNDTLKKRLINLSDKDSIKISSVKLVKEEEFPYNISYNIETLNTFNMSMKELYDKHKDSETNLLILRVTRNTMFKTLKKYINSVW